MPRYPPSPRQAELDDESSDLYSSDPIERQRQKEMDADTKVRWVAWRWCTAACAPRLMDDGVTVWWRGVVAWWHGGVVWRGGVRARQAELLKKCAAALPLVPNMLVRTARAYT